MLFQLPHAKYENVRPLFATHREHTICMCGFDDPATRIVVDNVENPQSALMVTQECWGYLSGNPDNREFTQAVNRALWDRKVVSESIWGLLLTAQPESWHTQMPAIVAPSKLVPFPRLYYTGDKAIFDWRSAVPEGYQIHPINPSLPDRFPDIEIPDDVQKLLKVEDPLIQGFGFAAVTDGEFSAHAMIDFIYDSEGDIGLYTQEAHRRKGLAAVTSAACIEYGLSHGLKRVRWDCHVENAGSIRTAEKLRLVKTSEYMMFYFDF